MAKIKQYRPNFFSGFENETVEFSTTEELLSVEFVKNFKRDGFSGFALSTHGEQTNLIATYKNGKEWWVVGFIDDISNVNLPKWEAGKAPKELEETAWHITQHAKAKIDGANFCPLRNVVKKI